MANCCLLTFRKLKRQKDTEKQREGERKRKGERKEKRENLLPVASETFAASTRVASAVKLLLVYFKLWKICANFRGQQKRHYNGQANSNEWDCECECECESPKRQTLPAAMRMRGNEGKANAQTRWKCSTICCEICALCVFSNNAKTFRLCAAQGRREGACRGSGVGCPPVV